MNGSRLAVSLVFCSLLAACSTGIGRGVDPRDSTPGANGAVAGNNNMGVPGAISLISGPAVMDWLSKTFMPNERSDAPPPPLSQGARGESVIVEQDCTNPAHRSPTLPCP